MEITSLTYFLEIVRQGNISRAAAALHVTQPALTRQMQRLEEELGVRLFARGRKIRLTDAGQMLKDRAEEIVRLSERTMADLKNSQDVSGVISIGMRIFSANILLSEIMEAFSAAHPHVRFALYVNTADDVSDRIERSLLDFGLMLQPVDVTKFSYIELRETERMGLLLRTSHPLAEKGYAEAADLKSVPLIVPSRQSVQNLLEHALGISLEELRIFAENNICPASIHFVRHGTALLLAAEGACTDYLHDGLTFIPLKPQYASSTVFVWNKHLALTGAQRKFLDFFQDRLAQYRSGINERTS